MKCLLWCSRHWTVYTSLVFSKLNINYLWQFLILAVRYSCVGLHPAYTLISSKLCFFGGKSFTLIHLASRCGLVIICDAINLEGWRHRTFHDAVAALLWFISVTSSAICNWQCCIVSVKKTSHCGGRKKNGIFSIPRITKVILVYTSGVNIKWTSSILNLPLLPHCKA